MGTFLYISFGGYMHSFLLGKYLGVQLLIHGGIYLALVDIDHFLKWLYQFKLLSAIDENSCCSSILHQHIILSVLGGILFWFFTCFLLKIGNGEKKKNRGSIQKCHDRT